jgi:pilus assembly protein CpaF
MIATFGRHLIGTGAEQFPSLTGASSATGHAGHTIGIDDQIHDQVLARMEPSLAVRLSRPELLANIEPLVSRIADERHLLLNREEQVALAIQIADEIVGLGPVEPLLHDDTVSDILINGPKQVYVERHGKLELTEVRFRSDAHVLHLAHRIAASIGRRIDESSPMLDARLPDGSRVNCITSPLSLQGTCISIRKFAKTLLDLDRLRSGGSLSPRVAVALQIAARCRLNIVISGGTGSGKTTLLNAMSRLIDQGERIVTIEDTAELQLQQPHVIRLETRPPNIEGFGQVPQRDLVRNALRMRPDRIIVGEVRGGEAFDMLQAMNTGHNGSMSTVHANSTRDALSRIENLVLMANVNLPSHAIRGQVASAIDLVIQIERMRDGVRRVTEVTEVVDISDGQIKTAALWAYHYVGEGPDGSLRGVIKSSGEEPRFLSRLDYYGLKDAFVEALAIGSEAA